MGYWIATRLQAHCENKAEFFLQLFGYETYLPKVRWRTGRGRTRSRRVSALFPGYIFVRVEQLWRDIRTLPGVIRPVMSGDEPAHVPDVIIAEIRSRERNGFVELPKKRLQPGDRVLCMVPESGRFSTGVMHLTVV